MASIITHLYCTFLSQEVNALWKCKMYERVYICGKLACQKHEVSDTCTYTVRKVSACCVRVYVHLCVGMHLTLYFIGLQVEVLQGGGDCGNGCKFVIRKVQFHQAGEVEDLWADAAALQTTVT